MSITPPSLPPQIYQATLWLHEAVVFECNHFQGMHDNYFCTLSLSSPVSLTLFHSSPAPFSASAEEIPHLVSVLREVRHLRPDPGPQRQVRSRLICPSCFAMVRDRVIVCVFVGYGMWFLWPLSLALSSAVGDGHLSVTRDDEDGADKEIWNMGVQAGI